MKEDEAQLRIPDATFPSMHPSSSYQSETNPPNWTNVSVTEQRNVISLPLSRALSRDTPAASRQTIADASERTLSSSKSLRCNRWPAFITKIGATAASTLISLAAASMARTSRPRFVSGGLQVGECNPRERADWSRAMSAAFVRCESISHWRHGLIGQSMKGLAAPGAPRSQPVARSLRSSASAL